MTTKNETPPSKAERDEHATLTELLAERKRWDTDEKLRAEFANDRGLFERHLARGVDAAEATRIKAEGEAARLGRLGR